MKRVFKRIRRLKKWFRTLFPTKRRVDFVICGTQKGGTTALDQYLRGHNQVCMAEKKEVHFFNEDKYFIDGVDSYPTYHSHFSPSKRHKLMGEASPVYMYWDKVPKRIFDYNPNMKLIVLLRNPTERAYSHWNMMRLNGDEELPFLDAIRQEKVRCSEKGSLHHRLYSYIDRGFYLKQLRRLWKYFPKNNILIIRSDWLKNNPEAILQNVTDFLNIERFENIEAKNVHSLPYNKSISLKEENALKVIFQSEILNLEKELELDLSEWLK